MKPCALMLTCADDKEADIIVKSLLDKKLIVCSKKSKVSTDNYWEGKIEHSDEVLLVMDSAEEMFEKVEDEVRNLHSYKTFNLVALPVMKLSRGVKEWMEEGLKQ